MAIYAFDGTWNRNDVAEDKRTNVWRFYIAAGGEARYRRLGRKKSDSEWSGHHYRKGVGTRYGTVGRLVGGLFGGGAKMRLRGAYRVLYDNYVSHGDHDIDIVGFSRGAAMAVHFANVVATHGIRKPKRALRRDKLLGWGLGFDKSLPSRQANIRFLGLFDTVASFGLAIGRFQRIIPGFKLDIPADETVPAAAHALALDERRGAFRNERLTVKRGCKPDDRGAVVDEVWFRGVHGDVGGSKGLGDITFCWIVEKARAAGVTLDLSLLQRQPSYDRNSQIGTNLNPRIDKARRICDGDLVHLVAKQWDGAVYEGDRFESWRRLVTFKWESPPEARSVRWDSVKIDDSPPICA